MINQECINGQKIIFGILFVRRRDRDFWQRRHARILMDPEHQDAGIGIARGVTRTYWVLMLATKPRNSSPGKSWNLRVTL